MKSENKKPQKEIVLGKNIKKLMEKESLRPSMVAPKVGVSKSVILRYLKGDLPQGLLFVLKISELFDISLDELIFGLVEEPEIRLPGRLKTSEVLSDLQQKVDLDELECDVIIKPKPRTF